MEMADRYRRWFEYEQDAHQSVLASYQTVPQEERNEPAFQKALDLFAHLVQARLMWLFRLGQLAEAPQSLFPTGVTLVELTAQAEQMHNHWATYLAKLDDTEVARILEYRSLDGAAFRNSLEDIFTQLFGHSLYHRGQIAALIKSLSGTPAITDFIYWSREPLG